jgi:hypothetical protein
MKLLSRFVQGYGWETVQEFILSLSPSVKYHLTFPLLYVSWFAAGIEFLLGVKGATAVAFCVLATIEVTTGIYASLAVRKENYQSFKIGRFSIKLFVVLAIIYILNTFAKEFKDSYTLVSDAFEYLRIGFFAYSAQEYLVSVAENLSEISGKEKTFIITQFKNILSNTVSKFLGGNK